MSLETAAWGKTWKDILETTRDGEERAGIDKAKKGCFMFEQKD